VQVPIQFTEHFNRHIIRIASKDRAILGPLSSLAGCQPRALEVAGSNPAGPIDILGAKSEIPVAKTLDGKVNAKVIAGKALNVNAVIKTRTPIMYVHFTLQPKSEIEQVVEDYKSGRMDKINF
jgi:hypothetical protein